ncbi:peptidoglycan-binding protein [Ligilactobacillus pabuli]|uniref:Peptidoglycan-binding protein n=1 Tax=Ligilactobacillus pabuli TaxID=2886039 RepID=A0ABQ5JGK6_9LACO|nr:LysM peptidoglycan-binding domain-containing protein [Ligilactobacillus pabuli]GKS81204.1 peptidoglycan-binding protein [Ligilactobacillus pabuli]HIW88561.1 LysM peptidoglycan-binding domain-containing protein [Candidatus Ligilactobacillus excrementipullorum]
MGQIAKNVVLGSVGAAGVFLASAAVTEASNIHTVVQNDTVWALAQKYGVSEQQIESQNHIDPQSHVIYQGQKLTITGEKTPTQTPAAKTGNYTVQAGDSLWTIAQNAGISVAQLRAANQLGPDAAIIQPGQVLTVAGQTAAPVVSVPAAQPVQETPAPAETTAQPTESVAKETPATPAPAVKEAAAPVQHQAPVQPAAPATPVKAQPATPTTPAALVQQSVAKAAPSQPAAQPKAPAAPVKSAPVSQPVAKPVAQPVAKPQAKAPVSQAQPAVQNDEAAAKEWIAQKESGGSYTAQNHQYYGRYQLTDTYLHGDYSAANQEKVADSYVNSVYGTWSNAKQFWLENNWY